MCEHDCELPQLHIGTKESVPYIGMVGYSSEASATSDEILSKVLIMLFLLAIIRLNSKILLLTEC